MLCRFFLGGRRWVFSNYFPAKSKTFYPQIINKMTGLLTSNCHFMQKEKFLTNFFRIVTILTPLLMLIKSIIDKNFKNVTIEILIIMVYLMLIIFLIGFFRGIAIGKGLTENNKKKVRDG